MISTNYGDFPDRKEAEAALAPSQKKLWNKCRPTSVSVRRGRQFGRPTVWFAWAGTSPKGKKRVLLSRYGCRGKVVSKLAQAWHLDTTAPDVYSDSGTIRDWNSVQDRQQLLEKEL